LLVPLIIMSFFSFGLKWICGRRTARFTFIDVPIIIFTLMILSGGIFSVSGGSLKPALLYVCFISAYFTMKWLSRSSDFIVRAMQAIAFGAAIVSFIGICEYFIGDPSDIWQDSNLFASLKGRAGATFDNPNVLGEYLIMTMPISLALGLTQKSVVAKTSAYISVSLSAVCLICTWSRGAWLGIMLAGAAVLLLYTKKWLVGGIIALPVAGCALTYLNTTFTNRLFSIANLNDSSTSYRIGIWKSTLSMLKDTFWYGIGVGTDAFTSVFPCYAMSGITSAYHAHSLYLQIITETGIFSLITFVIIAFVFIQQSISFEAKSNAKSNKTVCLGILCGAVALLLQGLTDHVFYNYRIFLMFWLIIGLGVAHLEVAKESAEENEIMVYDAR
ncbi:MAG: O-antigen ligase family protein, partial [Clostridia bacterium]|nr:O-antigen ligase family protein [Clostridia bacterium]